MKQLVVLALAVWMGLWAGCDRKQAVYKDRSTPKGAVAAMLSAIDQRDAGAIRQSFAAEFPQEYIATMAGLFEASNSLFEAGKTAFGKDNAKTLIANSGPGEVDFSRFNKAEEKIEGDQAVLTSADGQSIKLKKENGQWKVAAEGSFTPANLAEAARVMGQISQILNNAAADVKAGKFKEVREVRWQIAADMKATLGNAARP